MKKIIFALTIMLSIALYAIPGMTENASVELGKRLFNDPTLAGSTNAKTCNGCHADGNGLGHNNDHTALTTIINRCITGPLKGTPLDTESVEMRSLEMYINSL